LRAYDYSSAGAYFVTICTKHRECFFGEIVDATIRSSEAGKIIQQVWDTLPEHFADIDLDISVVMPNHVHGIIVLTDSSDVGAGLALPRSRGAASGAPTLGDVIRTFKSVSAIKVIVSWLEPASRCGNVAAMSTLSAMRPAWHAYENISPAIPGIG
jgi:putative transposase